MVLFFSCLYYYDMLNNHLSHMRELVKKKYITKKKVKSEKRKKEEKKIMVHPLSSK